MRARFTLLLAALFSLSLCGCGSRPVGPFALEWRGVDSSPEGSSRVMNALGARPLRLEPVQDARPDPLKVGSADGGTLAVRSNGSVAQYVGAQVKGILTRAGARLVDSGEALVLQCELLEFNVDEGGTYKADARLRFTFLDQGSQGKQLWTSVYTGKSKRWGRSHSSENYNEALSNALAEAMKRFLTDDDGLAKALASG